MRNQPLADESYTYELVLEPLNTLGFLPAPSLTADTSTSAPAGEPLRARGARFREWSSSALPDGGIEARFVGRLDFGLLGPTDIVVEHTFRLPDTGDWFEEQIRLVHRFGRDTAPRATRIRFAFRKTLL